jgi:CDP-diacylglycerol--serine O-phosphatidyltransferase
MNKYRFRDHSINRLIPNLLTLLSLCAGLTAIKFALADQYDNACIAIVVAALFDALDGRIARILESASRFGAELDSLSDFLSFGVAPALMLYIWTMEQAGRIGWGLALLFCACAALRLARFNTKLDNTDVPAWAGRFFTGVPAPAGAGLALLPLFGYLEYGSGFFDHPVVVGINMALVAGLMVSRVPTFSAKRLRVRQAWVLPAMVVVVVYVALLTSETWNTLLFSGLLYLALIPFSFRAHRKLASASQKPPAPAEVGLEGEASRDRA